MDYSITQTPIGEALLLGDAHGLRALRLHDWSVQPDWQRRDDHFAAARRQLDEYFRGQRRRFELHLAPIGTPFQRRVWDALLQIPYGSTVTYGHLAGQLGQPTAARAVGLANGRNPIAVIIPCHRVIGARGDLVGYGGGLERKRWLLDLEARSGMLPAHPSITTAVSC